jgi:signal transduction histidine kinase
MNPPRPSEEAALIKAASSRPAQCRVYHVGTEDAVMTPSLPPCCPAAQAQATMPETNLQTASKAPVRRVRINWLIKAVLPVAFVLLNGLMLFLVASERSTILAVAATGAVAVCTVVLIVLAYLIHRPMQELQEKMSRLGKGDFGVSVSFAKQNDEIGDLGRDFNRMVEQLNASREEIERLHRTQMSRAEHLATLGELATGLAHEIRNPLAGIAGVVEIVGRDLPASSPARAVVKDVRQEISQINRILTDLLETARPRQPQIKPSDLNTTVEHTVMLARQQAFSKPIKIEFHAASGLSEVEHDSDQIHQVLLNLLLNAIQAIDGPGNIRVDVMEFQKQAAIVVADSGRGIAPENLPNIFRPFFTTKGNGTGLGLSLAHRIVEDHRGRIEVTSEIGKGSKFTVLLPFHRQAAVPA